MQSLQVLLRSELKVRARSIVPNFARMPLVEGQFYERQDTLLETLPSFAKGGNVVSNLCAI